MNQKLLISLLLIGIIFMCGCISEGEPLHSLGERVTAGDLEITVVRYRYEDALYQWKKPSTGATWLTIDMKIRNVGKNKRQLPSGSDIVLIYAGERIHSGIHYDSGLGKSIFPEVEGTFWIAHEVPKNIDLSDTIVSVHYSGKTIEWRLG